MNCGCRVYRSGAQCVCQPTKLLPVSLLPHPTEHPDLPWMDDNERDMLFLRHEVTSLRLEVQSLRDSVKMLHDAVIAKGDV